MRHILLLIVFFISISSESMGQDLLLRSGDHPEFSRVTIPLLSSQKWEARQTSSGIEVILPEFLGNFDTTNVFTRMQRIRITDVLKQEEGLLFKFSCQCIATAFRSEDLLVIDVADQGTVLSGPHLRPEIKIKSLKDDSYNRGAHDITIHNPFPWIGGSSPFSPNTIAYINDKKLPLRQHKVYLDQIQKALSEQFAKASSTQLLEYNKIDQYRSEVDEKGKNENSSLLSQQLTPSAPLASKNIRFNHSIDKDRTHLSQIDLDNMEGENCPNPSLFNIESWGDSDTYSEQINSILNIFTNDLGIINTEQVEDLAKLYIYFGFGAEALKAFNLNTKSINKNKFVADIAEILEFGHLNRLNSLSELTNCNSGASLWASLAFEEIPSEVEVNIEAILFALNKMPIHLRKIIAPPISDRLLKHSGVAAAANALRSLDRVGGTLSPPSLLAQANLLPNYSEATNASLNDIIESNSQASPQALINLVKQKFINDEHISSEMGTLIDAYLIESRGTSTQKWLFQAQILAFIQSENFEAAFEAVESLSPSISSKLDRELDEALFSRLSNRGPDPLFLEYTLTKQSDPFSNLSLETNISIASRLLDLGFPERAQQILLNIPSFLFSYEKNILSAKAAISLEQPYQAQAALIGIDTIEAKLILAQAKEMTGAYEEALKIFWKMVLHWRLLE